MREVREGKINCTKARKYFNELNGFFFCHLYTHSKKCYQIINALNFMTADERCEKIMPSLTRHLFHGPICLVFMLKSTAVDHRFGLLKAETCIGRI